MTKSGHQKSGRLWKSSSTCTPCYVTTTIIWEIFVVKKICSCQKLQKLNMYNIFNTHSMWLNGKQFFYRFPKNFTAELLHTKIFCHKIFSNYGHQVHNENLPCPELQTQLLLIQAQLQMCAVREDYAPVRNCQQSLQRKPCFFFR